MGAVLGAPALIAPLASGLVWLAAKLPKFPFEGKSKAGILAALSVVAVLAEVGLVWAHGDLSKLDAQRLAKMLADAVAVVGVAYGGHTAIRQGMRAVKVARWKAKIKKVDT